MVDFDLNLKDYAKINHVPISFDETMEFIIKTINDNGLKTVLEIGTAIGFGSISMASFTCLEHIDTLEIDREVHLEAVNNINARNLSHKITAHNVDAKEYIASCDKKYDFIYLDGPKGQYINYLPDLLRLLNDKGIIIADNVFFHGMVTGKTLVPSSCRSMIKGLHKFVEEITLNPLLDSIIYNIGDGVAVIKKK